MKKLIKINFGFFVLSVFCSIGFVNAAPITLFQSDGTDASIFDNLTTIGDVRFNTPLANIFGRDINLNPLSNVQRSDNDFFNTLAEAEFLTSSNEIKTAEGILFSLGNFNNSGAVDGEFSEAGINWQIGIPQGTTNRRLHVQFGPGGDAAPGGPDPDPAAGGGRKAAVLHAATNVPGQKHWGQFINNLQIPVVNGDIAAAIEKLEQELIKRSSFADDAARVAKYTALVDGTRFVDPMESFYIDLINDGGNAFNLELEVLFSNNLFSGLAQFLDNITIEIGDVSDFPEIYNDISNDIFLGTVPFGLDLNDQGNGQGGIPLIQINSMDVFTAIPEPPTVFIFFLSMIGLASQLKKKSLVR